MKKIVSLTLVLLVAFSSFTAFAAEIKPENVFTGAITNDYSQGVNREVINFPYSRIITPTTDDDFYNNPVFPSMSDFGGSKYFFFTVQNEEIFKFYYQTYTNAVQRKNLGFDLGYIDTSNNFVSLGVTIGETSGGSYSCGGDGTNVVYHEKEVGTTGVLKPGIVYALKTKTFDKGQPDFSRGGSTFQMRVVAISEPLLNTSGSIDFRNVLKVSNYFSELFSPYYIYENALHVDSLKDGDTPVTIINPDENKITVPGVNGNWTTYNVTATYNVTETTFTTINSDHTETTFTYNTVDNSISISTVDNSTHTTITNNYYFYGGSGGGSDSGGGGSGGGSGGGDSGGGDNSWWQEILAGGISGIIDFVGSIIFGVFDGIIKLLDQLKDLIFNLVDFGASFVEFLGAFITFLPPEILTILSAGVAVAIFLGIWRLIKG